MHYIGALLIGAVVGFLSGLLGKGGSAVTTPALRVLLDVPRFSALASPLPVTIPTTLSAALAYRGRQLIDWPLVWRISALGVPATVLGSLLSDFVGGHSLMLMTAIFVLSLGVSIVLGSAHPEHIEPRDVLWRKTKTFSIAAVVGLLSGLLANSGGILFGPLFIRVLHVPTRRALPTSLIVSAFLAIPGTLAHWYLGHIDWALVAALTLGTIPFSFLGAELAIHLRSSTLERIYGIALVVFGIYDLLWTERALFLPK